MPQDDFYNQKKEIANEFLLLLQSSRCSQFTLKRAASNLDITEGQMDIIFPFGLYEVIEFLFKIHRDELTKKINFIEGTSISVKKAILTSFELLSPLKPEIIKIFRYISTSSQFHSLPKFSLQISDSIWKGIGSQDITFSYYTKRLTLAGIYSSCFIFFLTSNYKMTVENFLDMQLKILGKFFKLKNKLKNL